jgi:hypothetical protein
MCNFLSLVSTPQTGGIHYFNLKIRKELAIKNIESDSFDSHTYICNYFNLNEDTTNKYEYNPFTKEFVIDQQNARTNTDEVIDDQEKVKAFIIVIENKGELQELIESGLFKLDLLNLKFIPQGLVLPTGIQTLFLSSLQSAKDLVLPTGIQTLYLSSLQSAKDLVLPTGIQTLYLSSLQSAKDLVLPTGIQNLDLSSLQSAKDLVLPTGIQTLYLRSLQSAKDLVLPTGIQTLYLRSEIKRMVGY